MDDRTLSRRRFLQVLARYGLAAGAAGAALSDPAFLNDLFTGSAATARAADRLSELAAAAPRARYWAGAQAAAAIGECLACHAEAELPVGLDHEHESREVRCLLCARECRIPAGGRGRCNARMNVDGELRSLVWGRPIAVHVDPIEKKPFYHFLPGARAFSLATSGCPLTCRFCQNWEISQARPEDYDARRVTAREIGLAAESRDAPVIAFTYNEPTVFLEYLVEIARAAREHGMRSAMISCGYMNEAPLRELCGALDAIKIDLKGFAPEFYREVCDAELAPVLRSIEQAARADIHLELVNLVVPTLNDSDAMIAELVDWVVANAGPDVPVHFTRFHPDFQLRNLPPTPAATLERARETALRRGLRFPYVGNLPGHPGNDTYCPACGQKLIDRRGFFVIGNDIRDGACAFCGEPIPGVWS